MAEIINLAKERKRRERQQRQQQATQNRAKSGLPKAEKTKVKDALDRQRTRLDGHKRDEES